MKEYRVRIDIILYSMAAGAIAGCIASLIVRLVFMLIESWKGP